MMVIGALVWKEKQRCCIIIVQYSLFLCVIIFLLLKNHSWKRPIAAEIVIFTQPHSKSLILQIFIAKSKYNLSLFTGKMVVICHFRWTSGKQDRLRWILTVYLTHPAVLNPRECTSKQMQLTKSIHLSGYIDETCDLLQMKYIHTENAHCLYRHRHTGLYL